MITHNNTSVPISYSNLKTHGSNLYNSARETDISNEILHTSNASMGKNTTVMVQDSHDATGYITVVNSSIQSKSKPVSKRDSRIQSNL